MTPTSSPTCAFTFDVVYGAFCPGRSFVPRVRLPRLILLHQHNRHLPPVFPRLKRMRKKFTDGGVVAVHNVSDYQMALDTYHHELAIYAWWFDEEAHSAALSLSYLIFPRSLWDYLQPSGCELTFATTI